MPESAFDSAPAPALTSASLWEVFQVFPNGVCVLDREGRFVACNAQYRNSLGVVVDLLCPGVPFEDIVCASIERGVVVGGDQLAGTDWIASKLTAFEDRRNVILRFADGREMRVEQSALRDGGLLITLTDVTILMQQERSLAARVSELEEMKSRLEAQSSQLSELAGGLSDLRDEAERANRTKSEFLANMSHELRSPLNAVIGFAEIMKDELFGALGSAQYREYAYDIWTSGRHLLDLINDILDLSKIEAGKLDLLETRFSLGSTIGACIRLISGRAQQADIALHSTVTADGVVLWADERKLKQVLINLLTNAIKFTKPGGRVKVAVVDGAGTLDIRISDTGIGMTPEEIPIAMAAFGQVDSSLARKHDGTGLGLPLSKALVELHDGTLEIESEAGIGTTVTVKLPAERILARSPSAAA